MDAVAPDALDLERGADDRRRACDRQEQGDQPLAPPRVVAGEVLVVGAGRRDEEVEPTGLDRKSTRLNSSHLVISYAVFCLKKKKKQWMSYQIQHSSSV